MTRYVCMNLCVCNVGLSIMFLLPGPKTVCVSVCLSVCLCVARLSQKVMMKFSRMVYNDKISLPFEDEMNRFIRTEVTEKLLFRQLELRPFDNLFLVITSPFLLFKR